MTETERRKAVVVRRRKHIPWHQPPHDDHDGNHTYLITAACFEHQPVIGVSATRIADFEEALIDELAALGTVFAWCVLPNHYHALFQTEQLKEALARLGRLHGRTSHCWNGEDDQRGRKVWFRAMDRRMRSGEHFWKTVNYLHHNPVKHGYVDKWTDWPFSSASDFLQGVKRAKAIELWERYPIDDYGADWDED